MRIMLAATLMAMAFCIAGGCGSSPPSPPDPAAAREALETALATWEEGKPPETLRDQQPVIDVSDHQWSQGLRLAKHQIEDQDRSSGADHVFRVALWLDKGQRKPEEVHTEYFVGTSPTLRVIRSGL